MHAGLATRASADEGTALPSGRFGTATAVRTSVRIQKCRSGIEIDGDRVAHPHACVLFDATAGHEVGEFETPPWGNAWQVMYTETGDARNSQAEGSGKHTALPPSAIDQMASRDCTEERCYKSATAGLEISRGRGTMRMRKCRQVEGDDSKSPFERSAASLTRSGPMVADICYIEIANAAVAALGLPNAMLFQKIAIKMRTAS